MIRSSVDFHNKSGAALLFLWFDDLMLRTTEFCSVWVLQEPAVPVQSLLQDRWGPTGGAPRPAGETDEQKPETVRLLGLPLLLQVNIEENRNRVLIQENTKSGVRAPGPV